MNKASMSVAFAIAAGKNKKTITATTVLEVEDVGSGTLRGVTRFLVSGKVITNVWNLETADH